MLSLYIHIPFCDRKCEYCNFFVIAKDSPNRQDQIITHYLKHLHQEIDLWSSQLAHEEISTIYFGGGTPGILSFEQLSGIIDHIYRVRNCEYLSELSIELNPNPFEETLSLVQKLTTYYRNIPRVRCSFGIQTFDDRILQQSGREYVFNNVRHFLRELREIKQATNVFNLDFIAFGTRNEWTQPRKDFLENMINSITFDSYSLYLLELFPGSKWHMLGHHTHLTPLLQKLVHPDETLIMSEYNAISSLLINAGYNQYEASNRSLAGKESIHNHIYRTMKPYLGLGTSASGLLSPEISQKQTIISSSGGWTRYTNTHNLTNYGNQLTVDPEKTTILSEKDYMTEFLMLGLRTSHGIKNLSHYVPYLSTNRLQLINDWSNQGLVRYNDDHLVITHEGMKISNHLITDLLTF